MVDYTRTPDDLIAPPPYQTYGCYAQSFFVEGTLEAQQAMTDMVLNQPTNGEFRFNVVTSKVLVACVYARAMGSLDPLYQSFGVSKETDIGVWTLVHGGRVGDEGDWKFYWLPSYLFIDTGAATCAGRENFGYPKSVAAMTRQTWADGDDGPVDRAAERDANLIVNTMHFPVHTPTTMLQPVDIITITQTNVPSAESPAASLARDIHGLLGIAGRIAGDVLPFPHIGIPQILMRQFRDATRPGQTCVKEIVVATPTMTTLGLPGLIRGDVTIDFAPSASHDIARFHGVQESNPSVLSVYVPFDFRVDPAVRLWSE
jgi:hypothetical protein